MFDNSIFEHTQEILGDFSYEDNRIDYRKAITMDVAYCYSIHRGEKYNMLRYVLRLFMPLQSTTFVKELASNKVLFTSWTNRRDYMELINSISSEVPSSKAILIHNAFKRRFKIPRFYYVSLFQKVFRCRASFATKMYISFRLLDYVVACKTMDKQLNKIEIDWGNRKYVPFNSSFGLENAITQLLNIKGCKTYHLCHGLHFSPNYRFFSIDAFNKELITAKVVLSWGQGFVDNDNKLYNHSYIHEVVGNPKYPYKKINIKFNTLNCIVLLARGQYDQNNYRLLDVLSKFKKSRKIEVSIKPHPTDNISKLTELCKKYEFNLIDGSRTIKELLSSGEFGFAISYETTAYFEAMYYNLLCFRFSYEENESYGDFDDRFASPEELEGLLVKYSTEKLEEISANVEKNLCYEIGMGINRYRSILN